MYHLDQLLVDLYQLSLAVLLNLSYLSEKKDSPDQSTSIEFKSSVINQISIKVQIKHELTPSCSTLKYYKNTNFSKTLFSVLGHIYI